MSLIKRLVAVSYAPPAHNHHKLGVDLKAIREQVLRIAEQEQPDFVCFPEICACSGDIANTVAFAPELEPFAAAVGEIAREANTALVVPLLERHLGRVFNSVPIVDRAGKLTMVYRKNFPTTGELDAGVTPGWEVPVAECDGVRVGAAVCFDANFDSIPDQLATQRARLVFWPSMFWGGKLLQHWALRYGFTIVVAFGPESAVIDMNGDYLVKQGLDTWQVRGKRLPPWAACDVNLDRELFHLDFNQNKFADLRTKYGRDIDIEVHQPEAFFLLASRREGLTVEQIAKEFQLETLRDYLARSVKLREDTFARQHLPPRK